LASRWPRNFAFLEGPRAAEKDVNLQVSLSPEQRDEVSAAFKRGFQAAQKRFERDMEDAKLQEEFGGYCSEMAVLNLWLGDVAETVIHADNAVGHCRISGRQLRQISSIRHDWAKLA